MSTPKQAPGNNADTADAAKESRQPGPKRPSVSKEAAADTPNSAAATDDAASGPTESAEQAPVDSPVDAGSYFAEHPYLAEDADPVAMQAEIENLRQQQEASQDKLLRAHAELENARRRAAEDVTKAHKFAVEKFAGDLLAVKDSLEAALANDNQSVEDLRSGVELTLKQLNNAFEKSALRVENPAGEKFDPNRHQAIGMVESEQAPNTVVEVLQKGYLISERVLRPAMVTVASKKDK